MAKIEIDTDKVVCAVDFAKGSDRLVMVVAVHDGDVLKILTTSEIYGEREDYARLQAQLLAQYREQWLESYDKERLAQMLRNTPPCSFKREFFGQLQELQKDAPSGRTSGVGVCTNVKVHIPDPKVVVEESTTVDYDRDLEV